MENNLKKLRIYLFNHFYLILGGLIASISLAGFFSILENIKSNDGLIDIDVKIEEYIRSHRLEWLDPVMICITNMAGITMVLIICITIAIIFLKLKKINYLVLLGVSLIGGYLFVILVKELTQRERPSLLNALVDEKTFSFPSGHSFIAVSLYGMLSYILFKSTVLNKYYKTIGMFLMLLLIPLIGFSRLYLGAHWLSDIIASFLAGTTWVISLIILFENRHFLREKIRI